MAGFWDRVTTQTYTPIIIQFNPWILREDESALEHDPDVRYRLRISAPRSNRRGEEQYIADSILLDVPADGLLKFKLSPSDRYLPIGRYVVEYFRVGCSTPLDTQEWIVPSMPVRNTYSFVLGDLDPVLPLKVWRVLSVSPGDQWVTEYNTLTWRDERPLAGTDITVNYQPAATLDVLIDSKVNRLDSVDRLRG
jgi:hypothetical protein